MKPMVVNKETGFLEHPTFEENFNSEKKVEFLKAIENNPFHSGIVPVLEKLGIHQATYYKHLERDAAFRECVERLKSRFAHRVEDRLVHDSLKEGKTLAQFGVLRAYMPGKYNPVHRSEQTYRLELDLGGASVALDRSKGLDSELENRLQSARQIPQVIVDVPLADQASALPGNTPTNAPSSPTNTPT